MNKHSNCNNCGKNGHQYHQCKLPITSIGIILCRASLTGVQYLMMRRKNSFGYIDFIRGKYNQHNLQHLKSMFDEMSQQERINIKYHDFTYLWKDMWGSQDFSSFKTEENVSQKKFEALKSGILIGEPPELITLDTLINEASTNWVDTEWEFPKGRRNCQEKEIDCALREFEEETGISKLTIKLVENLLPFEEIFIGSNNKSYKHKYFLAYTDSNTEFPLSNFQKTEVSKLEWKSIGKCLQDIRPYHLEKKELIQNIDLLLQEYRLC